MVVRLDDPQPVFALPSIDDIPDNADDQPEPGLSLQSVGILDFPALIFGAAAFSHQYNTDDHIASLSPVRTIRIALRYGIRAFDTSAYYGPSEIVLGTALKTLQKEFPRSSYKLTTKCGRYGPNITDFDYSSATIRASVKRSLTRLNTEYLDAVYLHDVEFVCTPFGPTNAGNSISALNEDRTAYGLADGDEGRVRDEGDRKILEAIAELRKMQEEGLIKSIGITGYPLPTLLRLALLVLHTPPYKPLDLILSYCHLTIQNDNLRAFTPHFYERAKVAQVVNTSPLGMGLLTPSPPAWHPAPSDLIVAAKEAITVSSAWVGGLPNLALGYAMRHSTDAGMPMATGYSTPREVHESIKVWRQIQEGVHVEARKMREEKVVQIFDHARFKDFSWASP